MASTRILRHFSYIYPVLTKIAYQFKNSLIGAHDKKIHEQFLKNCVREHVCPSSLLPRRLRSLNGRPFGELEFIVLKHHIEITNNEKTELFNRNAHHKYLFLQRIPEHWRASLFDACYDLLRRKYHFLQRKLFTKLQVLIRRSAWTRYSNDDCLINLSSKEIDQTTKCALGYGIKFTSSNFPIQPVAITKKFRKIGEV